MASGRFDLVKTLGTSSYIYSRCEWSSSGNVNNNRSTINVNVIVGKRSGSNTPTTCTFNTTVSVSGANSPATQTSAPYTSVKANQEITVFSGSFTINHNADGTKGTTISVAIGNNNVYHAEAYSNITLDTIPRASTPSVRGVGTMGGSMIIDTNRASGSFTHTLTYLFGNASGTIATGVGTDATWNIPIELASQVPNAPSGIGTITCTTYSGSTNVGSKTCQFTLNVPDSIRPTAALTFEEANLEMISKNWGIYVQGKSELDVSITGTGAYGSTIKSYQSYVQGISSIKQNYVSWRLTNHGTSEVTAYVVDTRERKSETVSQELTVVEYFKPTIRSVSVSRCLEDGTESDEGTYLLLSFAGIIAPVANKNSAKFSIKIREKGADVNYSEYILSTNYEVELLDTILADGSGNKLQLSTDVSYDIRFEAIDAFDETHILKEIGTGFDLINLNVSGNSMALGKISEADPDEKLLEVGFEETRFSGDVTLVGDRAMVVDKHIRSIKSKDFFDMLYNSDGMTGSVFLEDSYFMQGEDSMYDYTIYGDFYNFHWMPFRAFTGTDKVQEKPYYNGTLILYSATGAFNPVALTIFNKLCKFKYEFPSGNSDNYSESEQIIGTWIDGKTLYRKVITTYDTVENEVKFSIAHGVSGWDKMWVDLGNSFFYENTRKRSLPMEQTFYTSTDGNDMCHVYIEGDYVYIVSRGGWGTGWLKVITLNYTKV
jgi:hypothetical protein